MKIPVSIAAKVAEYEEAQKKADQLFAELQLWFNEHADDCVDRGSPYITDTPTGDPQGDGEYCDQIQIGEDWYQGTYYYPIEDSDKYVAYPYGC